MGFSSVQAYKPSTSPCILQPYAIHYYVLPILPSKCSINWLPSTSTIEGRFSLGNKVFFLGSQGGKWPKVFTTDLDLHHLRQWPLNSSAFVLPSQQWVLHTLGTVEFSKGKSDPNYSFLSTPLLQLKILRWFLCIQDDSQARPLPTSLFPFNYSLHPNDLDFLSFPDVIGSLWQWGHWK